MKYYLFSLTSLDAEAMWDFAKANQVNFKFFRQEENTGDPLGLNKLYTYGGYMSEETYLMFRLTVPVKEKS